MVAVGEGGELPRYYLLKFNRKLCFAENNKCVTYEEGKKRDERGNM